MVDLEKTKSDLLLHLEALVKNIQQVEMPRESKTFKISTSQLRDHLCVEELINQLPKQGSHIYWFEVDKPKELIEQFKSKSIDTKIKFARDNKSAGSEYVYVGSCTKTKLGDRFRQHCGWGNDQTYSLQLQKWLTDDALTFTFTYAEIADSLVAQQLEDQLHRELMPLFGKSGGNNKITVLK